MNTIGMPTFLIAGALPLFGMILWLSMCDYKNYGNPSTIVTIILIFVAFCCMLDGINDLAVFFNFTVLHAYTLGIVLSVFNALGLPVPC